MYALLTEKYNISLVVPRRKVVAGIGRELYAEDPESVLRIAAFSYQVFIPPISVMNQKLTHLADSMI